MGMTAENVARQWQITRQEQDKFAVASQHKAVAAKKAGRFADKIAPVTIKGRKGDTIVSADEYIKENVTLEDVAKLRPAFDPKQGTVTAANASGINDGAAALAVMKLSEAERRGIQSLARIVSYATAGVDPSIMGTGPIPATKKALERAGWSKDDLDLVEANEAFAAQSCAVSKTLGSGPERVNVNGGAIAIGHPIGASGARILTTLLYETEAARRQARAGRISASAAVWGSPDAWSGVFDPARWDLKISAKAHVAAAPTEIDLAALRHANETGALRRPRKIAMTDEPFLIREDNAV